MRKTFFGRTLGNNEVNVLYCSKVLKIMTCPGKAAENFDNMEKLTNNQSLSGKSFNKMFHHILKLLAIEL